jgi:hypothetical protein
MQKWGLIHPAQRINGEASYAFTDVTVIRQADAELAGGASFRAVMRNLLASRVGQLAFDFRLEAEPAKVLQLKRPEPPPLAVLMDASPPRLGPTSAERQFVEASSLDDGDPANQEEALSG